MCVSASTNVEAPLTRLLLLLILLRSSVIECKLSLLLLLRSVVEGQLLLYKLLLPQLM